MVVNLVRKLTFIKTFMPKDTSSVIEIAALLYVLRGKGHSISQFVKENYWHYSLT